MFGFKFFSTETLLLFWVEKLTIILLKKTLSILSFIMWVAILLADDLLFVFRSFFREIMGLILPNCKAMQKQNKFQNNQSNEWIVT